MNYPTNGSKLKKGIEKGGVGPVGVVLPFKNKFASGNYLLFRVVVISRQKGWFYHHLVLWRQNLNCYVFVYIVEKVWRLNYDTTDFWFFWTNSTNSAQLRKLAPFQFQIIFLLSWCMETQWIVVWHKFAIVIISMTLKEVISKVNLYDF